jgi:hypothetical protein
MQRSFIVIGCFLSGCVLILLGVTGSISVQGVLVTLPFTVYGVSFGKAVFLAAGAMCLGVQTHCYKAQKRIIEAVVKGIE